MKKAILILTLCATTLFSKSGGVDIGKLIAPSFSKNAKVTKKQFVLKGKALSAIQNAAKAKVDSRTIRFYTVKSGNKVEGYAVLLLKTMRTKKAVVLYITDTKAKIKSIEIVAFQEPHEFKPKKSWQNTFKGKSKKDNLYAGKGIPTISGATLSARGLADASRIAIAVVERYR